MVRILNQGAPQLLVSVPEAAFLSLTFCEKKVYKMKYLSVFTHPSTCPPLMNNTEHINHFQPDKATEVSRGSSSSLMKRVTERRSKTLAEPPCTKECSMSSPSHNIKEQTQESDGRNATRTSFAQTSDFTWYQRIRL